MESGASSTPVRAAAVGGPVILGGDDLTDHGDRDPSSGANVEGWLYIQRALENVKPNVRRANDNSVAALGSSATGGGAGDAIQSAAGAAGYTVTYHDGGPNITSFFGAVRAGLAKPAVIWISGDRASNDLGDDPTEGEALRANAVTIADFVNSGGGLLSHGSDYRWLFGLLPGAVTVDSGSSNDLYLTPQGTAAFPGLTANDVNAGPWHNYFEGDFGGLGVLVRSSTVKDAAGNDAAVVIGGAAVRLPGSITLEPSASHNTVGSTHTVTATVRNNAGALQAGVQVTFVVTSGPNAGVRGTGTTDANGQVRFAWNGSGGVGEDTVTASFTDQQGNTFTATATKRWADVAGVSRGREDLRPASPVRFETVSRFQTVSDTSATVEGAEETSELPATGLGMDRLLGFAAALLMAGFGLLAMARRRRVA